MPMPLWDACSAALLAVAMAALVVAAVTDLARRIVPNGCVAVLALASGARALLACGLEGSFGPLARALAGGAAVLLVMLVAAHASAWASGVSGVGGGDVKLLSAAGLWMGPARGLLVVAASCLTSLTAWLLVSKIRYLTRHKIVISDTFETVRGIPLAPGIALMFFAFALLGGPVG